MVITASGMTVEFAITAFFLQVCNAGYDPLERLSAKDRGSFSRQRDRPREHNSECSYNANANQIGTELETPDREKYSRVYAVGWSP